MGKSPMQINRYHTGTTGGTTGITGNNPTCSLGYTNLNSLLNLYSYPENGMEIAYASIIPKIRKSLNYFIPGKCLYTHIPDFMPSIYNGKNQDIMIRIRESNGL